MTSRWPLLILKHVQANGKPQKIGEEETRASSSNATPTSSEPTDATTPMSASPLSVLAGPYPSKLATLPSPTSCGKFVGSSIRTFKPEIPEKYDGRLNQVEFLSIYTIPVQAAGGRDEKVFSN